MRFVDSNVFLHAFLTPRRELTKGEQRVKDKSKAIVKGIEDGEEVAITTVHLSEVINILESGLSLQKSLGFLAWIITKDNIKVYPTAIEDYEASLPIAMENDIDANDALAYISMKRHGLEDVYTFDRHFNQLKDIRKLPPIQESP